MSDLLERSFAGLTRIFQANATAGVDSSIQFVLTGTSETAFYALIKDRQLTLLEGRMEKPRVTMSMPADDFLAMLDGTFSPTDAFASGKLKVGGNVFYAMKLAPVFKFGS